MSARCGGSRVGNGLRTPLMWRNGNRLAEMTSTPALPLVIRNGEVTRTPRMVIGLMEMRQLNERNERFGTRLRYESAMLAVVCEMHGECVM